MRYNYDMRRINGFTLFELLIVIAVICLLSAVVLLTLPESRGKGNDAAVKADLGTLQVQAIQYFSIGSTYGMINIGSTASCTAAGTVFNDSNTDLDQPIQNAVLSVQKNANGGAAQVYCRSNANSFVVSARLTDGTYWCVDSTSVALPETAAPAINETSCSH
jgi:prepilin-type N-terminal cleavage/methylation domain-containing protein